ncbi:MAG: RAMP superfamily CRISPR-associated protein [Bryobacteraceae bacterium]|nr:RAMP superfamily CRISPR-associated protein [Bryobacteraceae bacterium]MDW8378808.1 RAMP superfamily CRISPR-associated protein [Bryobacterales bacterium]
MTKPSQITIELLSDTTLGQGSSTPGLVDVEILHDDLGLPYLSGKTLRGLIRDSWLTMANHFPELDGAAMRIWGPAGDLGETSILRFGDAQIDASVREWINWAEHRQGDPLSPATVLEAFTEIRSQTAEDRITGASARTTLRSIRVLLRNLRLTAPLTWIKEPGEQDLQCLALSVLGTRHLGLGRNRGRGFVRMLLDSKHLTRALAQKD